jgi:glycosyltransferase involved in cell wall biosynthesis
VVWNFFAAWLRISRRQRPDVAYVYMCPIYLLLLCPMRWLRGVKVAMWYGHTSANWFNRFLIRHFADVWLTSNQSMATFESANLRLVGHGVDGQQFFPMKERKEFDLVTVGRVTPVKKIEVILDALEKCQTLFGRKYTLNIIGKSTDSGDEEYASGIQHRIEAAGLREQVTFSGEIPHDQLPAALNRCRAFVFTVPGGIGKAALEAMACGLPVVIASPGAEDFFDYGLEEWFICDEDADAVARCINRILQAPEEELNEVHRNMEKLMQGRYTLEQFVDRVVAELA